MLAGQLGGKTAVISGAASWLGGAQAKLFAREGARVALGDRCFHSHLQSR
jgi:2,5-dichloro-2,5-cyclohexadiene-1,4-diol dehydrogenase 2